MWSNLYIVYYSVQAIRTFIDVEDNSEPDAQDDMLITKRLWLFDTSVISGVTFLPSTENTSPFILYKKSWQHSHYS